MSESLFPILSERRGFGSDNHSGAHPRILEAIARVNSGHVPSYGTDDVTLAAQKMFKEHFGPQTEAHFVFNGTAANVVSLSCALQPFHSMLASQHAHMLNDECGAPEKALGIKTIAVPSPDAKLRIEDLKPFVVRRGDQHYSQVRAISITQPTELGTLYTIEEIKAIAAFAASERLLLHMDGARLVNAAAALGCSLKDMTTDAGVDILSLGGTKNGLLFGEAVLFLQANRTSANGQAKLSENFKYHRKQLMQLPSKTRFIAAQFLEFLGTDLWLKNAQHANRMAALLAERLHESKYAEVTQASQANSCFVIFPREIVSKLREQAFFYVWNESTFECRLMTSWDTTEDDVDQFAKAVEELGSQKGH